MAARPEAIAPEPALRRVRARLQRFRVELWSDAPRSPRERVLLVAARTLVALGRGLLGGERNLEAGLLTFTTLMSLVPVLAVAFSLFTAFGGLAQVEHQALELVFRYLTPASSEVVAERLRATVSSLRRAPIGAFGVLFLALAVLALLGQIEAALNRIWQAPRGRPWSQRLPFYWSVATLAPLLFSSGLALSAQLHLAVPTALVPALLGGLGFFLTYRLLPNRPVRSAWALLGAAVGGALFELVARGFAIYTTRVVDYSVVYGPLAALPVFLLWLFVLWHIVLSGAEVAYANQHPVRYGHPEAAAPAPIYEAFGVAIACARAAASHAPPPDADTVADGLVVKADAVDEAARRLERAGLLRGFGEYPRRHYHLLRAPAEIPLAAIVEAVLGRRGAAVPVRDGTLADLV